MRVLFTTVPAYGHFHPLAPVASAAQRAGHDVAFAASPAFAPGVEAAGFAVLPAGLDTIAGGPSWTGAPRSPGEPRAAHWVTHSAPAMAADLLEVARSWRPDVIVRDASEFGGCVAAEALGVPHAVVSTGWFTSDYLRRLEIAPLLDALRASHGLPPDPEADMPFRYLFLAPMPERYWDPERPLPSTARFVRPVPFDRSGPEGLPEWVATLPTDRPTVHVTLGTVMNQSPGVFEAILEGLAGERVNVVATVGRGRDPEPLRDPGRPNLYVERYIPQSLLLPRCDLVVAHSGFGTVMGALGCGLPMVVTPLGTDQHFHAARVRALGVGEVLEPEDVRADEVRAVVRRALGDPGYRENARALRDEIAAMPGPEVAVDLLVRLVETGKPLSSG